MDQPLSPEIEPPPPSVMARARQALAVPVRLLGVLFVPDRTMPRVVGEQRRAAAFITITLLSLLAALVVGQRIDVSRQVLDEADRAKMMMGADAPTKSERELAEDIAKQRTIAQVKLGLAAGLETPALVFVLGIGLLLVGRYVGGRPTFGKAVTAAANGSLPIAAKSLLVALMAWPSASLTWKDVNDFNNMAVLRVPGDGFAKFASVDAFALWSVILLGFGLAAAAGMSRRRSFITIFICFGLYQLLTGGAR